jgi:hypothetical protein
MVVMITVGGGAAEIPRKINYQARLTDPSTGEPLVGNLAVTFRIYDDPLSGSSIWENEPSSPSVIPPSEAPRAHPSG